MPDTEAVVVAVAQLALTVGEPDANRQAARAAVAEAAAAGARLVVLPELSDSGYVFSDADEARSLASPAASNVTLREWGSLAAAHDLTIAGGFCELGPDGTLYNSAAIVDASGTRAVYRKAHLWDAEKKIFTPGDDAPPIVELPFGNVALMICYDLEFPEWVRLAALSGADLIAAPVNWPASGSPAPPGERPGEVVSAQGAASANGVFIAIADRCKNERGVDWVGGSVILRRGGYPLAGPVCADRAAVLTAAIDLRLARDKRISERNDLFADRRPDLYAKLWDAVPGGRLGSPQH
jgi:5-aminopentanamidase